MNNTNTHENSLEPAQFLVENVELLPKGRVLDVAMGNGRNAIYLARLGFEVEGVDISQESANTALELARKVGVAIKAGRAAKKAGDAVQLAGTAKKRARDPGELSLSPWS